VVAAARTAPKAPEQNEDPAAGRAKWLGQRALKVLRIVVLGRKGRGFHLGVIQVGNTAGKCSFGDNVPMYRLISLW
jgi:hypothetical protein